MLNPASNYDPRDPDTNLVVQFRNHMVPNPARSAAEGRPMFDDMEVCEIRSPGSRNTHPVVPALAVSRWITDPLTGEQRTQTYAERFRYQYQQFKSQEQQTVRGTPLEYAKFLTPARVAELRACNVLTVEQLANIDGQELKNLGVDGRNQKNAALEYLAESKTKAEGTQLAAQLEAQAARIQQLEDDNEALRQRQAGEGQFKDMTDEQVRDYIGQHNAGQAPLGNLSRKTLIRMAMDIPRPTKAA